MDLSGYVVCQYELSENTTTVGAWRNRTCSVKYAPVPVFVRLEQNKKIETSNPEPEISVGFELENHMHITLDKNGKILTISEKLPEQASSAWSDMPVSQISVVHQCWAKIWSGSCQLPDVLKDVQKSSSGTDIVH